MTKKTAEVTRRMRQAHRQGLFIQEYTSNGFNANKACEASGIAYKTYQRWKNTPEFLSLLEAERLRKTEKHQEAQNSLVTKALQRIAEALDRPEDSLKAAIEVVRAHLPEDWDSSIRKLRYEREKKTENIQPPNVSLRRGEPPARLALVPDVKTEATG